MPVGRHWDGDGEGPRDGSSSDQVSVGCGLGLDPVPTEGVGATVGAAADVCEGASSGVAASSSRSVVRGTPGVAADWVGRSVVALASSDLSSTSTGCVGCTTVSAVAGNGAAGPELVAVTVGPPMLAAAGIDTATRVPLA